MDLLQFQTAAKRTTPFGGNPQNRVHFDNLFGNYAMGLSGEAAEAFAILREVPISEEDALKLKAELGDISHYAVGLASMAYIQLPAHIELDIEDPSDIPVCETADELICLTGEILEHAKKVIYHRHTFDANELKITEVLKLVKLLAKAHGFKYSDVLTANIEKLKLRYPEKFNTADSIARVDAS